MSMALFQFAQRANQLESSLIREMLKLSTQGDILNLAGGLPAPHLFPVPAIQKACAQVLGQQAQTVLQYASSEGYEPLRAWLSGYLKTRGIAALPEQILITHGSQQGLDLLAKVLLEPGMRLAVESPTYLGALQVFNLYQPVFCPLPHGTEKGYIGPGQATARLAYVLPNFQNPSGRMMSEPERQALIDYAQAKQMPLVEDDPYGELWFEQPPPAALAARWPEGVVYLGSFSKILAPGLRLGYVVAPANLYNKLVQAKQATDLHTCGLTQHMVATLLHSDFDFVAHMDLMRAHYRQQSAAMHQALTRYMPAGCHWQQPTGGMFYWLKLPAHMNAYELLPLAIQGGILYVPGQAFFADPNEAEQQACTLRLSFATLSPALIEQAIQRLAAVIQQKL